MISNRQDYDAASIECQAEFRKLLAGSIFRLQKDDVAKCWRITEDVSIINYFKFSREDFIEAIPPELPEYIDNIEKITLSISRYKFKIALIVLGLLEEVESSIYSPTTDMLVKVSWEDQKVFVEDSILLTFIKNSLSLSSIEFSDILNFANTVPE